MMEEDEEPTACEDVEDYSTFAGRILVRFPIAVMTCILVVGLALSGWVFIGYGFGLNNEDTYFRVSGRKLTDEYDGFAQALDETVFDQFEFSMKFDELPERSEATYFLTCIYEDISAGENILRTEALQKILDHETGLQSKEGYSAHCLLADDGNGTKTCVPPQSVISLFVDPSTGRISTNESWLLETVNALPDKLVFFGKDMIYRDTSAFMRSFFMFGGPLPGFRNNFDEEDTQHERFREWVLSYRDNFERFRHSRDDDGVDGFYIGSEITVADIDKLVMSDASKVGLSITFIFLYTVFNTRSLWLAVAGMINIGLSFPLSLFIYRVVIGIKLFNTLNGLGLFIISGIGADTIFVSVDHFKATELMPRVRGSFLSRVSLAHAQSARAMFVTTFTTSAAFLACSVSAISVIRFFGIYCALLVTLNYLICVTWFAAAIVVKYKYINPLLHKFFGPGRALCRKGRCWERRKRGNVPLHGMSAERTRDLDEIHRESGVSVDSTSVVEDEYSSDRESLDIEPPSTSSSSISIDTDASSGLGLSIPLPQKMVEDGFSSPCATEGEVLFRRGDRVESAHTGMRKSFLLSPDNDRSVAEINHRKLRVVERFFFQIHSPLIYYFRWPLVVFFFVLLGTSIYFALQLPPQEENVQMLVEEHPLSKAYRLSFYSFYATSEYRNTLNIIWGVAGIDNSGRDILRDPSDLGTPIYRPFDLANPDSQEWMLKFCSIFRNYSHIAKGEENVVCFMEEFYGYIVSELNTSFPVPKDDFVGHLWNFTSWIRTVRRVTNTQITPRPGQSYDSVVGFDPLTRELRFCQVYGQFSFAGSIAPSRARKVLDDVNAFIEEQISENLETPEGMRSAAHVSGVWNTMLTSENMILSGVVGVLVSLCLAFLVVFLVTLNFGITIVAGLSMSCIVASVVSVMYFLGWKLGLLQSIILDIVGGFSADYVVHICFAFFVSEKRSRFRKSRESVTEMGISVVSAGFTTAGASVFLFWTYIILFRQFGYFLSINVVVALLVTFFPMLALLMVMGPKSQTQCGLPRYGEIWNGMIQVLTNAFKRSRPSSIVERSKTEVKTEVSNPVVGRNDWQQFDSDFSEIELDDSE